MSNPMREKLTDFRVYKDGEHLLGPADVQLPSLEAMTDTIKGAGIAGEVESPTIGHFGSMTVTINWKTIHPGQLSLAKPQAHHLEFRGAVQVYDAANGTYSTKSIKVVVKAIPKKTDLGKLETGAVQDTSWEGEVIYLKQLVDGEEKIELDKYNYIFKVDGEDQLAPVREALGM